MRIDLLNGSTLAFVGDAVLSLYVRDYLVLKGLTKTKELQEYSVRFVRAQAQAEFVQHLIQSGLLSEEEHKVYLRGRNHKSDTKAKNTDIVTYRHATGFEALIGHLHLHHKQARLDELFKQMIDFIEKEAIQE
jgi:ribonuclease-3 family protein